MVGGITSVNNAKIKNCYNAGTIQCENGNVGGIVGYAVAGTLEMSNCYNIATIGTGSYSGGIIGDLDCNAVINNCYNRGNITGTINKGGIIGYIYNRSSNNITLTNCSYLTGTASSGIGYTADSTLTVNESSTMPDVLSVINGDNAFVVDTNNINRGYPILAWQAQANK